MCENYLPFRTAMTYYFKHFVAYKSSVPNGCLFNCNVLEIVRFADSSVEGCEIPVLFLLVFFCFLVVVFFIILLFCFVFWGCF